MPRRSSIVRRKVEHIEVCLRQDVEFHGTSAQFECVHLIHQALPSFSMDALDTRCKFLGRGLAAPFLIGAMTGGSAESKRINEQLAKLAARHEVGLALGSQRPMLEGRATPSTYRIREIAPDILLLGNIGLAQATAHPVERLIRLMKDIGADGLCLHLNTAMELFQKGGDVPDGDAGSVVRELASALKQRLVVKETGCGISRETASRLAALGVHTVDVAGAGGTSWVRVENLRRPKSQRGAEEFEEWGIPTAASLLEMRGLKLKVLASGGVRSGLDVAKSIALGAELGSAALPVLRELDRGGIRAAGRWIEKVIESLRAAMMLAGARDLRALRRVPFVLTGPLREWAEQRCVVRRRH